jgi:hypothetical protein
MNKGTLQNILVFMERATATGKEAIAWSQTYAAVQAAIQALDQPPAPPDEKLPPQ